MFAIFLSLLTSFTFAFVNQKLPNNHLSYYGQEFYQNFPRAVTKEMLFKILNQSHSGSNGRYDTIGSGNCGSNCYAQVSLGYDQARKVLFGKLHIQRDQKGTFVEDVYCGKRFYFRDVNEAMRMNNEVNTEHTWPQSKFTGRFPKDLQKSDLHHLYPTDSEANSARGNYRFGRVNDDENELRVPDCDESQLSKKGEVTFEPPINHRGNVARSLFYFSIRYSVEIDPKQEAILRQWHKDDPVDSAEIARHATIAEFQKVRNPFVDYPQLVDQISDF